MVLDIFNKFITYRRGLASPSKMVYKYPMNIITVIPLSRSKVAEELIYFTSTDVPVGAIVTVPLRRKNIYAIVTKTESGKDIKAEIKKAPFEMRKLDKIKSALFFPASFIEASKILADYYATTIGSIIDTLVNNLILENIHKIEPPLPPQASFTIPEKESEKNRIFAVQGDDVDRMSSWRSLIRQEFAGKRSIAIYAPTIEDCNWLFTSMEKGIEGYIFCLHGDLTTKKFITTWKTIAETDHPIVVISTGSFPILPRADVKTVIIERENSSGGIIQQTPYLDIRHSILTIAKYNRQTIYLADSMLRTETLNNIEKEIYEEGSPFKWRSVSLARDTLVDMRRKKIEKNISTKEISGEIVNETKETENETAKINSENVNSINETVVETKTEKQNAPANTKEPRFRVLSDELKELILINREENTHLFIFAVRRGLSPLTVCDDCGNIVMCRQCKATVVLHTSEETGKNFFMCHICGDRRSAAEYCQTCNSWRLTPLGIGIDLVYEEIKKTFPLVDVFKVDSDTTKISKEIHAVIEKFRNKPGSILLGTELAMQNYGDKVDHVAIVSLDSLFSLPDFRIQEKIMYTLVRLRAQATRSILVQTRKTEQRVFEYGLKGNLSDFYRATLEERKQFDYPPFSILIKITIEGKKDVIANTMADVTKFLTPHEVDIFPAFTATVRGKSIIHGLIKIPIHAWPDADLSTKLRSLPPNVMVKVNPESLL